jgi:hypothetical protein
MSRNPDTPVGRSAAPFLLSTGSTSGVPLMKRPRGRPKGSGNPEDEAVLKKMALAVTNGQAENGWAAAGIFLHEVTGNSDEAKRRRLHSKFQTRKGSLLAEAKEVIEKEKEEAEPNVENELAELLAGKPKAKKIEAITAYLQAWKENWDVYHEVWKNLRKAGVKFESDTDAKLLAIIFNLQRIEEKWPDSEEKTSPGNSGKP